MSEAAQTDYLERQVLNIGEVDTSLANTVKRAGVLGGRVASMAVHAAMGLPIERYSAPDRYHPVRHARLKPDKTHVVSAESGSEHQVDIYGSDYLGTERSDMRPVVMAPELMTPINKGFKSAIIDQLGKLCNEQKRSLIIVSAEGFAGPLAVRQLCELGFDTMTQNVHDCLDKVEESEFVSIPAITTTGGSRGGTLSLLMGSNEITDERSMKGKPDRTVPSMVPIAPAGLLPMNTKRRLLTAKQFVYDEWRHVIRKASGMKPEELKEYGKSLAETVPPTSALPAIARTGLMFLTQNPLEGIGKKLPADTAVSLLALEKDYVASPGNWAKELEHLPNAKTTVLPGCHLSIDSMRIVYRFTRNHLIQESQQAPDHSLLYAANI